MTTSKAVNVRTALKRDDGEWLQVTPEERFRIRVASSQTMGAYSVIEIVADPRNGVALHTHSKEEEHFIVLHGTLDIAVDGVQPRQECFPMKMEVLEPWKIHWY